MSFQQGLSGLNASSKALDVTSNNVANSSTVGFKSASAHFADVYANSLSGTGAAQVGIGTSTSAIMQSFTQGNITTTNNPLDISINGDGFYRMSTNGSLTYSRNGQFHLDKNGYIVDDRARVLTGYPVDASTGKVVKSTPTELKMDASDQSPVATGAGGGAFTGVKASVNLDSRSSSPTTVWASGKTPATTTYNWSTALSIYDTLGNAHTLAIYAVKEGTAANSYSATATVVQAAAVKSQTAAETAATSLVPADLTTAKDAASNVVTQATTALTKATAAVTAAGTNATALSAANAAKTAANDALTAANNALTAATTAATTPTVANADAAAAAATVAATAATAAVSAATAAVSAYSGYWDIHASVDGTTDANVTLTNSTIKFNTSGQLDPAVANNGVIGMSINLNQVMTDLGSLNNAATPLAFNFDFTGSSQYGSSFGANRIEQDGYTSGRLTGVSVGADGIIHGNYSNGQARDLGQVVLASFTNPNGLSSLGGNQFTETAASGSALVGSPGSASLGALQSSSVEESNIDLTAELVNMITQQRNYQANAQSIKTQDSIMQTLVNLR